MTDSNVTELPQHISLDLDAEEKDEKRPPYRVKVLDRVIQMEDPEDLDWRDLILLESPMEFLRLCLSKEDRQWLLEQKIPGRKFNRLMEGFYNHYDLDEKVRQAQQRQRLASV